MIRFVRRVIVWCARSDPTSDNDRVWQETPCQRRLVHDIDEFQSEGKARDFVFNEDVGPHVLVDAFAVELVDPPHIVPVVSNPVFQPCLVLVRLWNRFFKFGFNSRKPHTPLSGRSAPMVRREHLMS